MADGPRRVRGDAAPTGLSYAPGAILRYSTLNLGPRSPIRHIALLTEEDVLPNGWALLAQLVGSSPR